MSYAAFLRGPAIAQGEHVKAVRKQHKYDPRTVEASIDLGERVVKFIQFTYDPETSSRMLEGALCRATASQPRRAIDGMVVDLLEDDPAESPIDGGHAVSLPYGFWRRFMADEMGIEYNHRKRKQFYRSLLFYIYRKQQGASTIAAMRGMRDRHSYRSNGGALNSRKTPGLGFELLQFFVDHIQRLMCRADSCLMLKKARELCIELKSNGMSDRDLPKLEGNAGHAWFKRWREMYNISRRMTGMKLKVPWAKVKKRIRVFLGNIYIACAPSGKSVTRTRRCGSSVSIKSHLGLTMLVTQALSRGEVALSQVCEKISIKLGNGILFSPQCLRGAMRI